MVGAERRWCRATRGSRGSIEPSSRVCCDPMRPHARRPLRLIGPNEGQRRDLARSISWNVVGQPPPRTEDSAGTTTRDESSGVLKLQYRDVSEPRIARACHTVLARWQPREVRWRRPDRGYAALPVTIKREVNVPSVGNTLPTRSIESLRGRIECTFDKRSGHRYVARRTRVTFARPWLRPASKDEKSEAKQRARRHALTMAQNARTCRHVLHRAKTSR